MPIYNVEKYLHRCIDSVINQTYESLEIILIDDGSPDNCGVICDSYAQKDERIKVIHKKNGGQSSARNAGLEIATGDYLSFVDSDDWIVEDIYEHCIDLIQNIKYDVIDFQCLFTKGTLIKQRLNENIKCEIVEGKEILRDYLLRGQNEKAPFTVWRKLYKRNLFNHIRFPEGKINEDITTNYKVLMQCKRLIHTDKVGYYYFQENNSTTRNALKRRDFDLLDACIEMKNLSQNEDYLDIKYLVKVKNARSYFSLLAKIAYYGVTDELLDKNTVIKNLTKELRKNYLLLMGSPMPLNRKIMATVMCININLYKLPLSLYKKVICIKLKN